MRNRLRDTEKLLKIRKFFQQNTEIIFQRLAALNRGKGLSNPCPNSFHVRAMCISTGFVWTRADSRFAPSQWETALLCNNVSYWLGANPGQPWWTHKLFVKWILGWYWLLECQYFDIKVSLKQHCLLKLSIFNALKHCHLWKVTVFKKRYFEIQSFYSCWENFSRKYIRLCSLSSY